MRICAITHNYPNSANPAHGVFAARQLCEMDRQGHSVSVFVPVGWVPLVIARIPRWRDYSRQREYEHKGLKGIPAPYLCFPGVWAAPWRNRFAYLSVRTKARRIHAQDPFDLIYARFLFPPGYCAIRLSAALGVPSVVVAAGSDLNVQATLSKSMYRHVDLILKNADGLVTSGPALAERIQDICGRRALPLCGVVDTAQFVPVTSKSPLKLAYGMKETELLVLYVGTLKKSKGVYEMLEAFRQVRDKVPNSVMRICGYGIERKRLENLIAEMGLIEVVRIVGRVDADEVQNWMQAADVLVLASYSEGMPNVVMEAMACGLPVVATKVGGLTSELQGCEGAVLVEPKDVAKLASALQSVLEDDGLRKAMGAAGRAKAMAKYSIQQNTRVLLEYLTSVTRKHVSAHEA